MITESPEDVCDFLVGNSQSFTCSVAGSPAPTITFYYNGLLLQESDQVVIDGGTLTISSAGVEHFGMYQCVVENDGGAAVATWPFLVRTPGSRTLTSSKCLRNLLQTVLFHNRMLGPQNVGEPRMSPKVIPVPTLEFTH